MKQLFKFFRINYKEFIFQFIVFTVLFTFYYFDQHHNDDNHYFKIAFFTNYAIAALIINYILLPKFYYTKKTLYFIISILILITGVILVEELVLEKIYFPCSRGKYFPGVAISLVDTLPMIIILVAFKFAWDFNKKQNEIEDLKLSIKDSELQFLKSQINPHFLFNNLNNLYAYSLEGSPKAPSIILELSSVLRYMLYDCKEDYVPLNKEIKHLKNFTALNELQIENRGTVKFNAENNTNEFKIAPLILMVFIENAFKHSTASQSDEIVIDISIATNHKGFLSFKCKNSFQQQSNTNSLSQGIGLANVKKRLELLYPDKHNLKIEDQNNVFSVNLTLELKK